MVPPPDAAATSAGGGGAPEPNTEAEEPNTPTPVVPPPDAAATSAGGDGAPFRTSDLFRGGFLDDFVVDPMLNVE